jgi:hypothetical protein
MQILIAGLAKTGTTGLLYLLNDSLPQPPTLMFEPKVCPPEVFAQPHSLLAKIILDAKLEFHGFLPFPRKITLVRDPRDRLVSALLYSQYHADYLGDDTRVARVRELLERKERDPASVSIARVLETMSEAAGKPARAAPHVNAYARMLDVFDRWCAATPDALLYKYEDFVEGRYAALEAYLGIPVAGRAVVPEMLKRVERTRDSGSWRHWFTEEDVALIRPGFEPWLARYGYDAADWRIEAHPVINPQHASQYYMRLVEESRAKGGHAPAGRGAPAAGISGPQRSTGTVQRADTEAVTGWAIGADSSHPVRLALKVNGREVAQGLADKPRPALVERGVHPTGRCGFVFRFEGTAALSEGDQVAVEPVGADFALRNSPRRVAAAAPR